MKFIVICINLFVFLINMVNAVTLVRNSSGLYCDNFKCPAEAVTCTISQKTRPDLTKIDYVRLCIDGGGNVIDRFENTVNNPHPGSAVNSYISSGGGGFISSGGGGYNNVITQSRFGGGDDYQVINEGYSNYDSEEVRQTVNKALADAKAQREYWQKWTQNFNHNLQRTLAESLPRF